MLLELGSHRQSRVGKIERGVPKRIHQDTSDETCHRVRKEDERQRKQDAPALRKADISLVTKKNLQCNDLTGSKTKPSPAE